MSRPGQTIPGGRATYGPPDRRLGKSGGAGGDGGGGGGGGAYEGGNNSVETMFSKDDYAYTNSGMILYSNWGIELYKKIVDTIVEYLHKRAEYDAAGSLQQLTDTLYRDLFTHFENIGEVQGDNECPYNSEDAETKINTLSETVLDFIQVQTLNFYRSTDPATRRNSMSSDELRRIRDTSKLISRIPLPDAECNAKYVYGTKYHLRMQEMFFMKLNMAMSDLYIDITYRKKYKNDPQCSVLGEDTSFFEGLIHGTISQLRSHFGIAQFRERFPHYYGSKGGRRSRRRSTRKPRKAKKTRRSRRV
jgi:hypothetical protein